MERIRGLLHKACETLPIKRFAERRAGRERDYTVVPFSPDASVNQVASLPARPYPQPGWAQQSGEQGASGLSLVGDPGLLQPLRETK